MIMGTREVHIYRQGTLGLIETEPIKAILAYPINPRAGAAANKAGAARRLWPRGPAQAQPITGSYTIF